MKHMISLDPSSIFPEQNGEPCYCCAGVQHTVASQVKWGHRAWPGMVEGSFPRGDTPVLSSGGKNCFRRLVHQPCLLFSPSWPHCVELRDFFCFPFPLDLVMAPVPAPATFLWRFCSFAWLSQWTMSPWKVGPWLPSSLYPLIPAQSKTLIDSWETN